MISAALTAAGALLAAATFLAGFASTRDQEVVADARRSEAKLVDDVLGSDKYPAAAAKRVPEQRVEATRRLVGGRLSLVIGILVVAALVVLIVGAWASDIGVPLLGFIEWEGDVTVFTAVSGMVASLLAVGAFSGWQVGRVRRALQDFDQESYVTTLTEAEALLQRALYLEYRLRNHGAGWRLLFDAATEQLELKEFLKRAQARRAHVEQSELLEPDKRARLGDLDDTIKEIEREIFRIREEAALGDDKIDAERAEWNSEAVTALSDAWATRRRIAVVFGGELPTTIGMPMRALYELARNRLRLHKADAGAWELDYFDLAESRGDDAEFRPWSIAQIKWHSIQVALNDSRRERPSFRPWTDADRRVLADHYRELERRMVEDEEWSAPVAGEARDADPFLVWAILLTPTDPALLRSAQYLHDQWLPARFAFEDWLRAIATGSNLAPLEPLEPWLEEIRVALADHFSRFQDKVDEDALGFLKVLLAAVPVIGPSFRAAEASIEEIARAHGATPFDDAPRHK